MADVALSSKSITSTVTGAYYYIIIPDGGSPTGFVGHRISDTNLKASLQSQITTNAGNIATNISDISDLQDINKRWQQKNQSGPSVQFAQPLDSTV